MSCEIDAKPFGSSGEPIPQTLGQIGSTNSVFKISQRAINMDSVAHDLPPVTPTAKKSPLSRSSAIHSGHPVTLSPISPSEIGRTVSESPQPQNPKKLSPSESGSKVKQKLDKSISDSSSYVSPKAAHASLDKAVSDSGTFTHHKPAHPGEDKIKLYRQHHQNLVQRVRSLSDEAVGPELELEAAGGRGAALSPLSNDGHPADSYPVGNAVHLAALTDNDFHDTTSRHRSHDRHHGHHGHHGPHDSSHHSLSSASSQSSVGSRGPPVSQGAVGLGHRVHALEPLAIPEHQHQHRDHGRHHHSSSHAHSNHHTPTSHHKATPPRELEKITPTNRFNPELPCSKGLLDKMSGTSAADKHHLAQIQKENHYYDEKRDDFQVHYRHPVDLVKKGYYEHNVVYEDDEINEGEHFYY